MSTDVIDFKKEVERLSSDKLISASDNIAILGGAIKADQISEFIAKCNFYMMPYKIWEYTNEIKFVVDELPDSSKYKYLVRGRIFGPGGDMEIRRESDIFLWHFIGQEETINLENYNPKNFWTEGENSKTILRQYEESSLLWGDYKEDLERWQDDRVGWAFLNYPIHDPEVKSKGKRLEIHYSVFSYQGQVQFIWFKEVKEYV